MRRALAALGLLMAVALGCGDGVVIVSFSSGTIVSDPSCGSGTGRFDLQTQGGLVLLVVMDSDTAIFVASGQQGRCADLTAGTQVQVRGPKQGTQITARSVSVE